MAEDTPDTDPHVINVEYWAQIPEALLYDHRISDGAVRVYGVLRRHGDDPTNCYPSYKRIAGLIDKSPRTIPALIRSLEDNGWIDRIARPAPDGDWTSNAYRVYSRAQKRGVRAKSREGSAQNDVDPSAQNRAPNESNTEPEQFESHTPLSTRVQQRVRDALSILVERDLESIEDVRNERAARRACKKEREEDGTRERLEQLAGDNPDWPVAILADHADEPWTPGYTIGQAM